MKRFSRQSISPCIPNFWRVYILTYYLKGLGPCLFGTLGLVFLMPPNIIGGKYVEKLQDQQLQEKDLRIKVVLYSAIWECKPIAD